MKKLLLSVILCASAIVKADVALETTFKEGDKEAVAQTVVLSESLTQVVYNLNDIAFKVVTTKMSKNEEGVLEFGFDFIKIVDGIETLVAQPEITGSPATLTLGKDDQSFTFVVNEVESAVQEVVETNDQV